MFQWQPYALLPLTSAVATAVVAVLAWRQRHSTPAARALALVLAGSSMWAAEDAVGAFLTSLEVRTALTLLRFPAVVTATFAFAWLCWSLADRELRVPRRLILLSLAWPVLVTVAAATNPWHGLLIRSTELVGRPSMLRFQAGPLFYVHSFVMYSVLVVTAVVIIRNWSAVSDLHRRQLTMALLTPIFPVAGNVVTLVQFSEGGGGDYAVLGFVASALVAAWAVLREGVLRLVPVARGKVLERVSDAVLVLATDGRVLDLNTAATDLARRRRPDLPPRLIGLPVDQVFGVGGLADRSVDGEYTMELEGERVDLDVRATELTDRRGRSIGRVVVARDVTELNEQRRALRAALSERDALAEALRHQAFHDSLTGLANRSLFADRLAAEYARARRQGGAVVAVLVDLDDFKPVNDRLGHHAGDLLLQEVANRLLRCLPEVDTVARIGGDEFAIVLSQPRGETAAVVAQDILDSLQMPCSITGERIQIRASIGVAVDHDASGEPDQLLRTADAAMYVAKERGKGTYTVFDAHFQAEGG